MREFVKGSCTIAICFTLIIVISIPAFSQFEGKDRKIAENMEFLSWVRQTQHDSLLVPAKKTLGLFWVDPNKNLWFAQISKKGSIKGIPKIIDTGVDQFHVIWIGTAYIAALDKYYKPTNEWLIHLTKFSEAGTKIGGYTYPQMKVNNSPDGRWYTHRPNVAYNGKDIGLVYYQQNWSGDGLEGSFFQRLNKNRGVIGQRQFMMKNEYITPTLLLTCSKKDFVAGFFAESTDEGIHLQRFSPTGAKLGVMQYIDDGVNRGAMSFFNMVATGNGYAVVYDDFFKGLRLQMLDSKLNLKGKPETLNGNSMGGTTHNYVVLHKDEIWVFFHDVVSLCASKADLKGNVMVYKSLITGKFKGYTDYPFGLASFKNNVYFAFIRYEPSHDETDFGTIYIRKMKK